MISRARPGRRPINGCDDPGQLTGQVLAAYDATPDPRLRELLGALVRHLHEFAVETRLTPQEWLAGVEFLTATGRKCDHQRQEFILLSDVLGLSSLVDLLNAAGGATESTVLGPFYVPGAPRRQLGEQIGRPEDGSPALVRGRVTSQAGQPLEGASLDVWQASGNGLYDTQDPQQPPFNLRGIFQADPDGRFEFRTVAAGQLSGTGRRPGRRPAAQLGPARLARGPHSRHRLGARASSGHHPHLRCARIRTWTATPSSA